MSMFYGKVTEFEKPMNTRLAMTKEWHCFLKQMELRRKRKKCYFVIKCHSIDVLATDKMFQELIQ